MDIEPINVEFPLRGEWMVLNSPGNKIPSHGTDFFAQTYAYDFVGVDPNQKSLKLTGKSNLDYLVGRARLNDFYGWGKPIFAPFLGTVVEANDGYPEKSINLFQTLSTIFKNISTYNPEKLNVRELAGNYVILKGEKAYAVIVHMRTGSVKVKQGDEISKEHLIGEVGHSGNSTAPHLHFQLMDNYDPLNAKGIPCAFKEYELFHHDKWVKIKNGIPKNKDRIRYNPRKSD